MILWAALREDIHHLIHYPPDLSMVRSNECDLYGEVFG